MISSRRVKLVTWYGGTFFQLDTMIYRTEFTNAAVFKKLEEKIPQVNAGHAYLLPHSLPHLFYAMCYHLDRNHALFKKRQANIPKLISHT